MLLPDDDAALSGLVVSRLADLETRPDRAVEPFFAITPGLPYLRRPFRLRTFLDGAAPCAGRTRTGHPRDGAL